MRAQPAQSTSTPARGTNSRIFVLLLALFAVETAADILTTLAAFARGDVEGNLLPAWLFAHVPAVTVIGLKLLISAGFVAYLLWAHRRWSAYRAAWYLDFEHVLLVCGNVVLGLVLLNNILLLASIIP